VIAITFALPSESATFIRALRDKQRKDCGEFEIVRGKFDNRTLEILHTGVGEKICRRRIAMFLQDRQFDLLISAGFAGALDDELNVGDIFIAKNFSSANMPAESSLAEFPVKVRILTTTKQVIDSPEERLRLAQTTGAAAVDMETDFIARVCAERGLPMLSVRAISDTAARPLPLPPHILFDIERQKTKTGKLSLYLATHPLRVPRMISFIRQVRMARRALTRALGVLLRAEIL
jgi:adenosylhomocysteine nucleosidase